MKTDFAQNEIRLSGGDVYITQNPDAVFAVKEGSLLVYLIPLDEDGRAGRRLLIHEAQPGEKVPAFYENSYGQAWAFCFVALDEAVIKETGDVVTDALYMDFIGRTSVPNLGEETFAELLLEYYERNSVKEEGYLFSNEKEKAAVRERGLRLIFDLFDKEAGRRSTPESGNPLYDAAAYVCDRSHIRIAPFERVVSSAGRRFRVTDIARVSNFIMREVLLEDGWHMKDSDPMVGFIEKGHKPVALIPRGKGGYIVYDPVSGTSQKLDAKTAAEMELTAYAMYASFPSEKISIKEMIVFGLKRTGSADWIRFGILMLIGTCLGLLLPVLNEQIYDKMIPMGLTGGIVQLCGVLLACYIGNLSFTIVKNLSALRGITKAKNALMAAATERTFNLPESFYRNHDSAELSDRVLMIEEMFMLISGVGMKAVVGGLFSFLYLFQMHRYSPEMMKPALIMVLAVAVFIAAMALRQMKYEKEFLEYGSQANSRMYQFLSGIEKLRTSGVEDRALLEYLKPYGKTKQITMKKEHMTSIMNAVVIGATGVFSVVLYYYMMKNAMSLSVGQFGAFMTAFGAFSAAVLEAAAAMLELNSIPPIADRIKPILETLPEYDEESELPGEITGNIEINNISFAYDEQSGPVLKDISLQINQGEYIGIVGASGCGKSTLLKLLLGFEKPTSGKIYYDSSDIDRMDKRELRKKFGVVLQDGKLISGSIYDNIVISAPGATLQDAEAVAEAVGLADDIGKMPMGMHTVLSEIGGTISGGQQQRILIARAIAGKPKILFFDEATSALDNTTQAMVCDSLAKLNITRVVIAHRLSTIVDCDRIFVMDDGRIVEEGNFDSLMKQKGLFYELASRQMV